MKGPKKHIDFLSFLLTVAPNLTPFPLSSIYRAGVKVSEVCMPSKRGIKLTIDDQIPI
jgi:hypothetical protein